MSRSPATPPEALRPIGLAELDACAALQRRVDVKYVVGLDVLAALVERLAPTHRVLEIDGRRRFSYATAYLDSPDLRCYRDHLQGRRRRFKCRTRRYLESGAQAFEVKLKGARGQTVKHRAVVDGPVDPLDPVLLAFLRARVREAYGRAPAALQETLWMRFERATLVAPERGERLTCDVGLAFAASDGAARLAEGTAIIESKSRGGAAIADAELRALGVRPVGGCSKYALGVALTHRGVKANPYRTLLQRHFEVIA
jgi:VTC domain-containing protein